MSAPTPTIISGSSGAADITVNAHDYQCVMGAWRASLGKSYQESTVFCSGGWVTERAGRKQLTGSAPGYLSSGSAISDPLVDFSEVDGVAITLTADTGCSLSFTGHVEVDLGVTAAANSEFSIRFRSTGAVASTWVTA